MNLGSWSEKEPQPSPSVDRYFNRISIKLMNYSSTMQTQQTRPDLPCFPVPPQQKYALTEPTRNHCDVIRVTAQLGVLGRLDSQEYQLGQEVFDLGNSCPTATSTADFIQDLIKNKQVESHFFGRIKELILLKHNVQCQVAQLHLEQRGAQFNIMPKSLDVDSAGIFPSGYPLYLCRDFQPSLMAPRPLPCFGTLKTIDLSLSINFTGWNNLPRLVDGWSEEQQAPQQFITREAHRIQQQIRTPPPPMTAVIYPPKVDVPILPFAYVVDVPPGMPSAYGPQPMNLSQKPPAGVVIPPIPPPIRVKITYDEQTPPIIDQSSPEQGLPSKRARGSTPKTSSKESTLGEEASTSSNASTDDETESMQAAARLKSEVQRMLPANAIGLGLMKPPRSRKSSANDPDEHLQVNLPPKERKEFLDKAAQPPTQPVVSCAPPPIDAPPTVSEESSQGSEVTFKIPRKKAKPPPDPIPVAEPSSSVPISLKDLPLEEQERLRQESHEQFRASFKSDKHYDRALKRVRDDSRHASNQKERTRPRDRGSRKRDDRYDYRDEGY